MYGCNIQRMADDFWRSASQVESFPRSLEPAVFWALPLGVFKLPRLWVTDVQSWLSDQGIPFKLGVHDRPLHGCLIAKNGRGCILLNGTDDEDELRYSLAHEIGHFILDYYLPRQRAVSRLGPEVLEVFDARRSATLNERVHAVLSNVSIGFHAHLMERDKGGLLGCGLVGNREEWADELALELLAPEGEARKRIALALRFAGGESRSEVTRQVLQHDFGLPTSVAEIYGSRLSQSPQPYSVRQWLLQKG